MFLEELRGDRVYLTADELHEYDIVFKQGGQGSQSGMTEVVSLGGSTGGQVVIFKQRLERSRRQYGLDLGVLVVYTVHTYCISEPKGWRR